MNWKDPRVGIIRSILSLGFWNIYGRFDIVAASKRAIDKYESEGYISVDDVIEIVKDEVEKKRWLEQGYDVLFI